MNYSASEHQSSDAGVRLLLPGLVILVLVLLVAALLTMWHQHQDRMDELIVEDVRELTTNLRVTLNMQGSGLATAIQPIANDAAVGAALAAGDADGLLTRWQPIFESMRRDHQVTHLYFYNRYRICLLRVHAPAVNGDRVDRFVNRAAERTGEAAFGLELGPLGTLALRVVQPVVVDGRLVGYVELGREVADVLSTLRSRMEMWSQMAVIVTKKGLSRESWEHTQRQRGREVDWDLMPHHVVAIASQDHLSAAFAEWVAASAGSPAYRSGSQEVRADGKAFLIIAAPLQNAAGEEIGALLAMRNISEERQSLMRQLVLVGSAGLLLMVLLVAVQRRHARADQRLKRQQQHLIDTQWRLENIISASRVGTWEWDVVAGSIVVSRRWAEMLGIVALSEDGRMDVATWEGLFHPDDLPLIKDHIQRHFDGQAPFIEVECRMQHQDGHWVWILCRGRVFTRSVTNQPQLLFGTHSDISARKQAEADHLLLQQQKMAREIGEMTHANRLVALGTMMAGLAHEFNHPAQVMLMNQKSLRTMVGACAEVAKDLEGPAVGLLTWPEVTTIVPQLLDDMEMATSQLQELIENVQNYARPNEGVCHGVNFRSLVAVARSSLQLVASYARRSQVALVDGSADLEPGGPPTCNCIQQVVVNLLLNAIQASQSGDTVSIACHRGGGQIGLTITDDGPGIDPAVLAKLGQPFVTSRRGQGGHGLGLFICLQIVAEQGGSLELTPAHPSGTKAVITFPDDAAHEPVPDR